MSESARIGEHLEVLADALATPGKGSRFSPEHAEPPPRLLLCLGPCHGEYYLPLEPDDRIACIHDATHPVAVYQTPTIHGGHRLTPDLPTRVREAFEAELAKCAGSYDACCEEHHDAALAAVIAVVQEDRTREIVEWLGVNRSGAHGGGYTSADDVRRAIESEFGGTTHD